MPDFSQNFNRYSYCLNNPLVYTDPDGELIWIIPNIGWSRSGGLNIGISVVLGFPGGLSAQAGIGYFGSNDAYGYVGATTAMNTVYASYSLTSGGSVGYTAGSSPFSGLPISTDFGTVGVNYNISHNSWSGNVSSWNVDQSGWNFNPSVSAMIFPEYTTNFVRRGKFIDNDAMLQTFVDKGDYRSALDYFGFKGTYDKNAYEAYVHPDDPDGNIYYSKESFINKETGRADFDKLHHVADHEYWHHRRVVTGKYKKSGNSIAQEEYLNYLRNFRRQGLYRSRGKDILYRLNSYGTAAKVDALIIDRYCFNQPWHFIIYKIPRLW